MNASMKAMDKGMTFSMFADFMNEVYVSMNGITKQMPMSHLQVLMEVT